VTPGDAGFRKSLVLVPYEAIVSTLCRAYQWQQRRFAAPQLGFEDYATPLGKLAERFTAGGEAYPGSVRRS
jgi:hypothetical protein